MMTTYTLGTPCNLSEPKDARAFSSWISKTWDRAADGVTMLVPEPVITAYYLLKPAVTGNLDQLKGIEGALRAGPGY
jgi:hypothetical protein